MIGENSTGVDAQQPQIKPGDVVGHFMAINPLTGEKKWEVPLTDMPSSAGMLATGGGLVFTGKLTGEFIALDEETGKTLWQFKTGSSVNSTAITYTHKGRQYVTIASGLGGILATRRRRQSADRRLGVDVRVDAAGMVLPWTLIDIAPVPDGGGELRLMRRGAEILDQARS